MEIHQGSIRGLSVLVRPTAFSGQSRLRRRETAAAPRISATECCCSSRGEEHLPSSSQAKKSAAHLNLSHSLRANRVSFVGLRTSRRIEGSRALLRPKAQKSQVVVEKRKKGKEKPTFVLSVRATHQERNSHSF